MNAVMPPNIAILLLMLLPFNNGKIGSQPQLGQFSQKLVSAKPALLAGAHPVITKVPDVTCGIPRKGGYDPFDLTNRNLEFWMEAMSGSDDIQEKRISVATTIVGGQSVAPQEACWQVKNYCK